MLRAKNAITIACGISAGREQWFEHGRETDDAEKGGEPAECVLAAREQQRTERSGKRPQHNSARRQEPAQAQLEEERQHEPERELRRPKEAILLRLREDGEIGDAHCLVGQRDGGRHVQTQCPVRPDPDEGHKRREACEQNKRLLAQSFIGRVRREHADPGDALHPPAPAFQGRCLHGL